MYTSSSLSLAIVETRVHLIRMPVDYMALAIDVPDAMFDPVVLEAGIGPDGLEREVRFHTGVHAAAG